MNEQLDRTYNLIKQGQKQAAIDLLEPLIRADRDNEDAWWLLANATSDTAAKRNALTNVLRISHNDDRKFKAQTLLQQLNDDPFDFDIATPQKTGMSSYQELDEAPRKKSGGMGCGKIALIIVGIVGVCAVVACFGIFAAAGGIFQAISYPQNYNDMGVLDNDSQQSSNLNEEAKRDGYLYSGDAGDTIVINIDYESIGSPIIVIFDQNTQVPISFSQPETSGQTSLSFVLPTSGDYLVTVTAFKFVGQEFGFGEYTLEFEVR